MDCILVHGLRRRRVGPGGGWFERMTDALVGRWPMPIASARTQRAEHGLGVSGKPYYFYSLRAEGNFGLVVFLLGEVEGVEWPPGAKGATPFDSGGLWFGDIVTDPPLNESGRRGFFETHDVALADWRAAFRTYIDTRYKAITDYIRGTVAVTGTPQRNSRPAVVMGAPNEPRAWTWEVRVPHQLIARRLEVRAVCISEENRDRYLGWLWDHSPLTTSESSRIEKWIQDHAIVPSPGESETDRVEEWLVREVA